MQKIEKVSWLSMDAIKFYAFASLMTAPVATLIYYLIWALPKLGGGPASF